MSTIPPISHSRSAPLTSVSIRFPLIGSNAQRQRRCASILEHHPESGNWTGLKVEYQALALAAAAADHDLGIGGLFLLAQHRVMMLRNAGNNPRFASAADTELA